METQQTSTLYSSWETSLRAHMGQLVNSALEDPMTCEVMLNPDGRIWQERFGEPMKCIGTMRSGDAEVAFRTLPCLARHSRMTSPSSTANIPVGSDSPEPCLLWFQSPAAPWGRSSTPKRILWKSPPSLPSRWNKFSAWATDGRCPSCSTFSAELRNPG